MEQMIKYLKQRVRILAKAAADCKALPNPWAARLSEIELALSEATKATKQRTR